MDDQERGQLLVEQEKIQKEIVEIRKHLTGYGTMFSNMSGLLKNQPRMLIFANAPGTLGTNDNATIGSAITYDWRSLPSWEIIAQTIQDLIAKEDRLNSIKNYLVSG